MDLHSLAESVFCKNLYTEPLEQHPFLWV
uniref:Uncharacterized protein n=1 Tax=Anguilla anguilla TaxID=7936 RepID=A0A0E9RBJ0_ANGAN